MTRIDIWPVIHAERKALASDLQSLSPERRSTPSLCTQWTVRDVVAHMTATAKITPATFFPKLVGAGFSLRRMQAKDIAREEGDNPSETLERFEAIQNSVKHPPGPADTMLGETLIHSQDIRGALGIDHRYPTEALMQAADFYKGSSLIVGTKRRFSGITLRATDTEWSHGSGPEVAGPMLGILMAMTGRKAALDGLSGDGVAILRTRA
jgi:uncharacterized protein (TIGR03083 family)